MPGQRFAARPFAVALKERFLKDKVMDVAASVTFYGVLALFPFLLFLVTLAGFVLHPQQVEQFIVEIGKLAPEDAARIIAQQIRDIQRTQNVGLLTVGFVGAIWSASGGVVSVMDGFNAIHHVDETRPFWKTRVIAMLTTFAGGAVMLIAALVAVAVGPIARSIGGPVAMAVAWLRLPVAALLMAVLWAVLYHLLPNVKQRFRLLTPGSLVGVAGWLLSSWAFSFYVAHFGEYNKTYGAIGGAIVMLMWMWISAMFLLMGPLINLIVDDLAKRGAPAAGETPPIGVTLGSRAPA